MGGGAVGGLCRWSGVGWGGKREGVCVWGRMREEEGGGGGGEVVVVGWLVGWVVGWVGGWVGGCVGVGVGVGVCVCVLRQFSCLQNICDSAMLNHFQYFVKSISSNLEHKPRWTPLRISESENFPPAGKKNTFSIFRIHHTHLLCIFIFLLLLPHDIQRYLFAVAHHTVRCFFASTLSCSQIPTSLLARAYLSSSQSFLLLPNNGSCCILQSCIHFFSFLLDSAR